MGFTNFFFADGSTLYPPDQAMQAATDIPEPYVGAYINKVHKSGDEMLFEMRYLYWEFYSEGHTDPGSWQITGSSFLQKAASDGSPIGDPINFYPLPLLFHENNVYYYNNYHGYIGILPLDGSPEANIPLEYGWRIDRLRAISDNKILINAYVYHSEGLLQQYAFIDENGIIEYPEDGKIADIKIQEIIVSDIGAWYLLNPIANTYYGTNAAYLQYLEWQTWGNDDPNVTPSASLSMQSFPNPFKGQTQICLKLNDPSPLTLKIYNLRGQLVQKIAHDNAVKGDNYFLWDGKDSSSHDCAAGIYFLKAESSNATATIKTVKTK
jgi:hypothetical protein